MSDARPLRSRSALPAVLALARARPLAGVGHAAVACPTSGSALQAALALAGARPLAGVGHAAVACPTSGSRPLGRTARRAKGAR